MADTVLPLQNTAGPLANVSDTLVMSCPWTVEQWTSLDQRVSGRVLGTTTQANAAWEISRGGRRILRAFSSSFFLVTRFLPTLKRNQVNVVYAAVRYPDEIVDTFEIPRARKLHELSQWEAHYERALLGVEPKDSIESGIPWILAGFAAIVREHGIPADHYRSFLDAMRRDVNPAPFGTMDQLIAEYIYGSAIVVGYFLAHIYGASDGSTLDDTYRSASDLAIALQLTNFARDVAEDHTRGRLYIPLDCLATEGIGPDDYLHPANARALERAIAAMVWRAEDLYESAARTVRAFAPDTRPAISACIEVYRKLNLRMLQSGTSPLIRQSVPASEKLRVLPPSKYWRVPLAYLGGL